MEKWVFFQTGKEQMLLLPELSMFLVIWSFFLVFFVMNRQIGNGLFLFYFRYCLWIVGNGATLMNSNSVWRNVVHDAKKRDCFHNADEDKKLGQAIEDAILELELLDESESLFKRLSLAEKSVTAPKLSR